MYAKGFYNLETFSTYYNYEIMDTKRSLGGASFPFHLAFDCHIVYLCLNIIACEIENDRDVNHYHKIHKITNFFSKIKK